MDKMHFDPERFAPPPVDRFAEEYSQKSRTVATILALCLGAFGVHNFYLGYHKKGVFQVILSCSIVFSLFSVIWMYADFVLLLIGKINKDGEGKILS